MGPERPDLALDVTKVKNAFERACVAVHAPLTAHQTAHYTCVSLVSRVDMPQTVKQPANAA